RGLADYVADRDDLVACRLADARVDDVDVEAAFFPCDLAHPVLDDAHGPVRVVRGYSLAQTETRARFGEADDGLKLTWRDGDTGACGFSSPPNVEVFLLDNSHRILRHHRVDALRVGH